ncbi:hypothetical protein [Streptomyces vilmorinianum]|uniref:hypothetical protein n=1 Tax=Streptomyces vilmorinianum TaxID=3051092 RepID=UPI0010FBA224|nr:hypothetical protein [Streptomyces vilmorinianum]
MRPRGVPLVAVVALAAAAPLVLSGCDAEGELESAGATPTAIGPVRLWPDLPPASEPPLDYGETDTQTVPGIKAPGDDVRRVDPVAVVQAEVNAHPDTYSGADGMYEETARQIGRCGTQPAACPVMRPYYRDLTGNGRDELIVGIRMPEQQVGLRVYTAEKGGLTRIMATTDQVISVDLAGRDVIVRAASAGIPGYEYRTAWSWDEQQRAMLPTRDEIVRVKPTGPSPSPSSPSSSSPSPSPETAADLATDGP